MEDDFEFRVGEAALNYLKRIVKEEITGAYQTENYRNLVELIERYKALHKTE